MQIRTIDSDEHSDFLELVNAEIRPDGATTTSFEDYPVALGTENREGIFVAECNGRLAGGLACLIREYTTTLGNMPVAGIGSVVTHPDYRGQGVSTLLQTYILNHLRSMDIPLAVLWTDKPEIYAGRGFEPAGYEFHVDVGPADLGELLPDWVTIRPFRPADVDLVSLIYADHAMRTIRHSGDDQKLYTMPGTAGWVAEDKSGVMFAYVFCGKGADFHNYITEWGGQLDLVAALIAHVRQAGLADHVLIPCGEQLLLELLVKRGAGWFALASGQWVVTDPEPLIEAVKQGGSSLPETADPNSARTWLGHVDTVGVPHEGLCGLSIWGFDSV